VEELARWQGLEVGCDSSINKKATQTVTFALPTSLIQDSTSLTEKPMQSYDFFGYWAKKIEKKSIFSVKCQKITMKWP